MKSELPSPTPTQLDFSMPPLFIDRNIDSPRLAEFLTATGMTIHRHYDNFEPEADDEVLITAAANRGWVLLTADRNIEKQHLEACLRVSARIIFLKVGCGTFDWIASMTVARFKVFPLLQNEPGPLFVVLNSTGISVVKRKGQLIAAQRRMEEAAIIRKKRHFASK